MDLPNLLGVDLAHCETAAATAVARSHGALELLQGELLAASYRDSLAQEAAVILQVRPAVVCRVWRLQISLSMGLLPGLPKHHMPLGSPVQQLSKSTSAAAVSAAAPERRLLQVWRRVGSEAERRRLQDSGWLSMGDLASSFKLPVEYTSSIIMPQVGQAVPGRLYGQLIFTDAFISRIRAQARADPRPPMHQD